MASETLHISRQKGSDFCQENKTHDPIEQVECQNSCSSFCQCSKRSASDGSAFCFRERCSGQKLVEDEIDGPGKIKPIDSIVLSEPTIRHVENADENACSHCENESCKACGAVQPQDYRRTQKGNSANSLQDLFLQDNYDDGEDDDSDWEPVNHLLIKKWFCYNCTMPNFDDVFHCDVCLFCFHFLDIPAMPNFDDIFHCDVCLLCFHFLDIPKIYQIPYITCKI